MSIDLELVITARNYAVKAEQELLKARKQWKERFQALDDELQSLYKTLAERDQLIASMNDIMAGRVTSHEQVVKELNNENV